MDLDQGGTVQQWEKVFLGPSVGWAYRPVRNILSINTAGTFLIDLAISLVRVNVAGAVTLTLPVLPIPPTDGVQPGSIVRNRITILDIGGNAAAHPITIQSPAGATIDGLASILINSNFGLRVLEPSSGGTVWNIVV